MVRHTLMLGCGSSAIIITSHMSRRHAKCIVVTHIVCVLSVCLSDTSCPHCCMDPDVTWGNGRLIDWLSRV